MPWLWPAKNKNEIAQSLNATPLDAIAPDYTPLPLLDWTTTHRPNLVAGRPFDLSRHEYLRAIYNETAPNVVVHKSSQMGVSEYLLSYALHACDQRGATCLYLFPTEGLISDFSTARLGPALDASEYLRSISQDRPGRRGKQATDRITLKQIRDRFLYMRGAQVKPDGSASQLHSVDADVVVIDELDQCDPRVKDIAVKRLGHSQIAETRLVSTPTYPGVGIHAEYLLTDQREWFIPCPHCGERQPITIQNVVTEWDDNERPIAWNGAQTPWAGCGRCGGKLELDAPGEWIAACPDRPTVGYHVTKFASGLIDLVGIITSLQSWNETLRKETFNQDLGEPYAARGSRLTDTTLDECRRDYGHGVDRSTRCYMGIDVGKVLHVVIRQGPDPATGERKQLFAGEVTWKDAGQLINRYMPAVVVIDGLPETAKSRELQQEFAHSLIWLCYYGDGQATNKKNDYSTWNRAEATIIADRTRALDEMYSRIYEGINTLPGHARDIAHYYDQMKTPQRVVEERRDGSSVARYIGAGADHYAHAETYCCIASEFSVPVQRRGAKAGKLDY